MEKIVSDSTENVIEWVVDRINGLIDEDTDQSKSYAMAMIEEYSEWIKSLENNGDINYTTIKNNKNEGWTQEQEIDIIDPWFN
jgi:deoxyadenosine/deoxycytidine kinase